MSKKMKLDLEDLEIQSFVTSLKDDENNKMKGGTALIVCVSGLAGAYCIPSVCGPGSGCSNGECEEDTINNEISAECCHVE